MDLGTNVFHLLITEGDIHHFRTIAQHDIAVKLGEGGINKGIIQPAAFERGIAAMKSFKAEITATANVQQVKAIATSALRNASNGQDFINKVKVETDIDIEIVDGNREAGFIYAGVKASGSLSAQNSLIIDIGGGSVEFIICNDTQLVWKQSFEIGAARLMELFHHTDPIPTTSIEALELYLEDKLIELFKAIEQNPIHQLIGSAGAFETFAQLIALERGESINLAKIKNHPFNPTELANMLQYIILSNHTQRASNKAIIPVRVDMIVAAALITSFILQKLTLQNICLCTYSLKEGILAELIR